MLSVRPLLVHLLLRAGAMFLGLALGASLAIVLCGCGPVEEAPGAPPEACGCEASEVQAYVPTAYVANATKEIHSRDELVAMCDPGFLAMGGGCMGRREDGAMVQFHGAAQLDGTMSPVGWFCEAEPPSRDHPYRITASAICLHVPELD